MSDLATVLLVLALALAVLGALRFDLVKLFFRGLFSQPPSDKGAPVWHEHGHGKGDATLHAKEQANHKPPFHRSGRRG
ncbi:hypothetical protein RQP53_20140 [Paucibacter sp. APW11]|uniref:Uncharacterized protein n=1 Tax=Roseateles aquae TaxID=3077235 RepID=A0ABU3PGE0_9BURK|nr:hypothetical protein [Paucibacter sp. APW11]MDT9001598.1 hypothetical protein [Paucibacter sp. APW11]